MRDTIGQHARLVKRRVAEGLTVYTELELFEAHFAPKDTAAVPAHFAAGLEEHRLDRGRDMLWKQAAKR